MDARGRKPAFLLGVLVAACISAGWTGHTAVAGAPAQRAGHSAATGRCTHPVTPQGTITYSDWQFPSTMNGYQSTQPVRILVASAIFDSLYGYDGKGHFVPIMLTKYPTVKNGLISPDGKTVTVVIKPGLRWSNGKPLTAADEKFGWQVDMSRITGPACLGSCDVIKSFDVLNATTARLTLKHPAPTDEVLSYDIWPSFGWHAPDPNDGYARGDVKGAATWLEDPKTNFENSSYPTDGPYKIDQFTPGSKVVMSPDPYYSDLTCGAYIKQLIFQGYVSKAAMEAAAAGHETDMTQDYTPADLPALQQHAGAYKIWITPGLVLEHLELNVLDATEHGHPNALTNVKVRQALNLAIDKLALIQSALGLPSRQAAKAYAAWTPWISTPTVAQQFADRSITGAWDPLARGGKGAFVTPGTPAAIADAKKLLTRSGHPGGSGVIVDIESSSGNPVRLLQMDLLQQNWNQLGITTNVTSLASCSLCSNQNDLVRGNFGVADLAWLLAPDPDSFKLFFQKKYIERLANPPTDNLQNYAGVRDKLIDQDFDQAALTPSSAVKRKLYDAIQTRIARQVYWIPLYYRPNIATTDGAFTGFNPLTWNIAAWKPVGS